MRIEICENYDHMSEVAAFIMASQVNLKPDSILGLATGSTPIGMYSRLVEMCSKGKLDFSKVRTFNLDEYLCIDEDNDQSYHYFMNKNLFSGINVDKKNIRIPDGNAKDMEKECKNYDEEIASAGGIDIQVLGIGRNGHIGFNEPDSFLHTETHIVNLTEDTIKANSRFFESEDMVPKKAVTMGIGSIMKAKTILLMVSGKDKHDALSGLLSGKITTTNPSSVINMHPNAIIVCDKEAYYG